ncbi:hypothetical protein HMPREF9554_02370 [Treponema phagedenis F0421]|nr:hypothetical protein HMPREF9554_02370 [Treponema phagedenis F0421]
MLLNIVWTAGLRAAQALNAKHKQKNLTKPPTAGAQHTKAGYRGSRPLFIRKSC